MFFVLLFAKKRNLNFLVIGDTVAATAGIGIVFGRLASFINGELCRPSDVPWAVIFPMDTISPRHPANFMPLALKA